MSDKGSATGDTTGAAAVRSEVGKAPVGADDQRRRRGRYRQPGREAAGQTPGFCRVDGDDTQTLPALAIGDVGDMWGIEARTGTGGVTEVHQGHASRLSPVQCRQQFRRQRGPVGEPHVRCHRVGERASMLTIKPPEGPGRRAEPAYQQRPCHKPSVRRAHSASTP